MGYLLLLSFLSVCLYMFSLSKNISSLRVGSRSNSSLKTPVPLIISSIVKCYICASVYLTLYKVLYRAENILIYTWFSFLINVHQILPNEKIHTNLGCVKFLVKVSSSTPFHLDTCVWILKALVKSLEALVKALEIESTWESQVLATPCLKTITLNL